MHKNGETMAVKLLHSMAGLDDKLFEEEFHNIARLQHKNIVRLVGFCHETQRQFIPHDGKMIFADSKYMALCFEYMHNGSLDKFIIGIIARFLFSYDQLNSLEVTILQIHILRDCLLQQMKIVSMTGPHAMR